MLAEEDKDGVQEEQEEEDMEEITVPSFALDASAEDESMPESTALLDLVVKYINRPPMTRLHAEMDAEIIVDALPPTNARDDAHISPQFNAASESKNEPLKN